MAIGGFQGVHVLYGSASGLTGIGSQLWSGDSRETLVAADFGYSTHADLAIGRYSFVQLLYGSNTGLSSAYKQTLKNTCEPCSGLAMAAANFGKSSHFDLAVGISSATVSGFAYAGRVSVRYGSLIGVTAEAGNPVEAGRFIHDEPEENDAFGSALSR